MAKLARVAELADALALGANRIFLWGFDSPLSHQIGVLATRKERRFPAYARLYSMHGGTPP